MKRKEEWEIVTKDGEMVCPYCTFDEAAKCKAQLIAMDKEDGTYEKGFYVMRRREDK